MPNLNKHRKAITEAGYTLNKDGTQVTNKSGKTVAGTNDSGFFSGSSTLTKIFKGDTKAKGKKTESKPASKSSPSKSKRPSPRSPTKEPTMTKEQARKYTSASPNGTPTLMSQGGKNAETFQQEARRTSEAKGPERPKAASTSKMPTLEQYNAMGSKEKKLKGLPADTFRFQRMLKANADKLTAQKRDMTNKQSTADMVGEGNTGMDLSAFTVDLDATDPRNIPKVDLPSREVWEDMTIAKRKELRLPLTTAKYNRAVDRLNKQKSLSQIRAIGY